LEVNLKENIDVILRKEMKKKYGEITGGSSTIRSSYERLLQLSATAREILIAATLQWKVSVDDCYKKLDMSYTDHPLKNALRRTRTASFKTRSTKKSKLKKYQSQADSSAITPSGYI
jgi:isoquinoline 1-oxidoreductase beta subunit